MNKSMKPSRPVGKSQVAPLTPEEQQEKIIRFLSQKREAFTTGILFNLCHEFASGSVPTEAEAVSLVDRAVSMADHLLEKLYPLKEEPTEEAE